MRIRIGTAPIIALIALLQIIIMLLDLPSIVRLTIGLPFIMFVPGYTLLVALFPRRDSMDGVERLLLSLGVSVVIVPLLGLILNYTPWGITLGSVVYFTSGFILVASAIGMLRRMRVVGQVHSGIDLRLKLPGWGGSTFGKALYVVALISILGTLAVLVYVARNLSGDRDFTEFYVLGPEGKAADYPEQLALGEIGQTVVGVVNHQNVAVTYRVEVVIDGVKNGELGPLILEPGAEWRELISFTPDRRGDGQKVEFLLYKNGENEALLTLHLWVSVSE